MMINERKEALNRLHRAGFAVDEAVLYLDTHPCDAAALAYYRQARDEQKRATAAYEAKIGPASADWVEGCGGWRWVEEPWPWEREANY